jgi:hypothetical protein
MKIISLMKLVQFIELGAITMVKNVFQLSYANNAILELLVLFLTLIMFILLKSMDMSEEKNICCKKYIREDLFLAVLQLLKLLRIILVAYMKTQLVKNMLLILSLLLDLVLKMELSIGLPETHGVLWVFHLLTLSHIRNKTISLTT